MDDEYPGRILLAEANQWPDEVVDYFGDPDTGGDECHMAFHFPLMPRIFMAAHQGSREPISRMLRETSTLPENCQWGIFLRNHDELTLEMVDEHEREYMWSAFTSDPRMRANLGIRRRLAPLLGNDRDQLRLFTALLLSLPGSPILYYGDEIGMGDNIWLGDRDGVRTPMQWTPDRNAGFSTGDPGRLFLPVIMDSVYGHQAVNVEAQRASSSSMLWWTRTMIHARKEHPAFGLGSYQECDAVNPATLAFVRDHTGPDGRRDTILCLSNLSRNAQPVEIDLRAWRGCVLRELSGGVGFGPIGDSPCRLALPGWGFLWFAIEPR
jgi:maltose alpha-D-glucosyltransferase/alpha-amylase